MKEPEPSHSLVPAVADLPPADLPEDQLELGEITGAIQVTPAKLRENYAEALLAGTVTEEQLGLVTWLLRLGHAQKLSIAALARLADMHESTVGRLFNGRYKGSMADQCQKIEGFRELHEQRDAVARTDFVETSIFRQIEQAAQIAHIYQTIYPVYGESQTGKTVALEKIAERDKYARVVFVPMPSGGHLGDFLIALNLALGESIKTSGARLRERPAEVLRSRHLLLIDEIHQTTIVPGRGAARIGTIEYIRRLWDRVKCGVVLCGTNAFRDEVERGAHAKLLDQLNRRGLPPLQLPDLLPREDMDRIAKAYGLPAADEATHEMRARLIRTTGLRAYTTLLKMATAKATKEKARVSWAHFASVHNILLKSGRREAR